MSDHTGAGAARDPWNRNRIRSIETRLCNAFHVKLQDYERHPGQERRSQQPPAMAMALTLK